MSFHLVMPPDVTPAGGEDAALGLLARAGMVAVRAADLASPCGRGLGKDGRTALTAAGPARIRAGDLVVWLKPVAVTRAVVRRDGRIQAAGHPGILVTQREHQRDHNDHNSPAGTWRTR